MSNFSLEELIQKVSQTEKTPELGDYWKNRYLRIFDNKLFQLSQKTFDTIFKEKVDVPVTPFGDLSLTNHLDVNKHLDEIKLQSTIETAVRFLDACLEAINFTESAKFIVQQYRKIGLGINDFDEYLETKNKEQELQEIDKLGSIISNSSYRASENLAEEKGTPKKWENINKHLRAKSFEIWSSKDLDRRMTGLELSEEYDSESISTTSYTILPRRNSNILLLPPDLEWQIWSDRDDSAAKTEIEEFTPVPPQVELTNLSFDETIETDFDENKDNSEINFESENKNIFEKISNPQEIAPAVEVEEKNEEEIEDQPVLEKTEEEESFVLDLEKNTPLENQPEEIFEDTSVEEVSDLENTNLQIPFNIDLKAEIQEPVNSFEDEFQVGELVQILKENDPNSGIISQIVDIIEGSDSTPKRYRLQGGFEDIEKFLWVAQDLQAVDLDEILHELNIHIFGQHPESHETDSPLTEEEIAEKENHLKLSLKEELKQEVRQEIAEEIRAEYEKEAKELAENDSLEKEALRQEITSLKQQLEEQKSDLGEQQNEEQIKLEIDKALEDYIHSEEFEAEIEKRIQAYLESEEIEKEIEKRTQQRLAQNLKVQNTPATSSTISTLKLMKKYQK